MDNGLNRLHPVSYLQELMTKQRKSLPKYSFETQFYYTNNNFVCRLLVDGKEITGRGSNKQNAKFQAATKAVQLLSNTNTDDHETEDVDTSLIINYNSIGKLNEITSQQKMPYPVYEDRGVNGEKKFVISCRIFNRETEGRAATKKYAKQIAAHNMIRLLETVGSELNICMPVTDVIKTNSTKCIEDNDEVGQESHELNIKSEFSVQNNLDIKIEQFTNSENSEHEAESENGLFEEKKESCVAISSILTSNPVGKLNEYTSKHKLPYPSYEECGINKQNEFITTCKLCDKKTQGNGHTKKEAKQLAAYNMLKLMQKSNNDLSLLKIETSPINVPSDDMIIQTFKSLSIQNNHYSPENVSKMKLSNDSTDMIAKSTVDMLQELQGMNISFDIEIIQKDPYILVLKTNDAEASALMKYGQTYDEAFHKLIEMLLMVKKQK